MALSEFSCETLLCDIIGIFFKVWWHLPHALMQNSQNGCTTAVIQPFSGWLLVCYVLEESNSPPTVEDYNLNNIFLELKALRFIYWVCLWRGGGVAFSRFCDVEESYIRFNPLSGGKWALICWRDWDDCTTNWMKLTCGCITQRALLFCSISHHLHLFHLHKDHCSCYHHMSWFW